MDTRRPAIPVPQLPAARRPEARPAGRPGERRRIHRPGSAPPPPAAEPLTDVELYAVLGED